VYKQLFDPMIRGLFLCIITGLVVVFLKFTIGYMYPFLIAFMLAALLNPSVTYLENQWKIPRSLATLTVITSIFILLIGILFLLVNEIIRGTTYLMEKFPNYFHSFMQLMEDIINEHILPLYQSVLSYFRSLDSSHQTTIQENVTEFLENIANTGTNMIQSLIMQLPEFVGIFPNSLTITIFILLATFMMVNDWNNITKKLKELLPNNILNFISDLHIGIKKAFSGYLRAQLILIIISAVIIFIGLAIIGVEHALTIAGIAALVDLLPVIGTGIIFVPWVLYTFLTGDYSLTIGLSILYMTVIIIRQIIEPKVLSASIGINPLVSLIILFVTIQLWGLAGVLLAPIILISIYVILQSGIFMKMVQFIKG
jgi:sporulation integral membrane protein YtvI